MAKGMGAADAAGPVLADAAAPVLLDRGIFLPRGVRTTGSRNVPVAWSMRTSTFAAVLLLPPSHFFFFAVA